MKPPQTGQNGFRRKAFTRRQAIFRRKNVESQNSSQVEYDDLDRVTKQIYPGDEAVSVCNTYNYRGLLATMTDCNETSPLAYVSLINYD
ncbi:hypothetical protein KKF34_08780 [Myxococcota bacterium]|nr:hypothetical protein [Myxococcota bacterium]MBU1496956.1 hypothetical protein [Myxococcota bacterium]